MRRTNFPPVFRASRKLYRAVRALPKWVSPVGDGSEPNPYWFIRIWHEPILREIQRAVAGNYALNQPNAEHKGK